MQCLRERSRSSRAAPRSLSPRLLNFQVRLLIINKQNATIRSRSRKMYKKASEDKLLKLWLRIGKILKYKIVRCRENIHTKLLQSNSKHNHYRIGKHNTRSHSPSSFVCSRVSCTLSRDLILAARCPVTRLQHCTSIYPAQATTNPLYTRDNCRASRKVHIE